MPNLSLRRIIMAATLSLATQHAVRAQDPSFAQFFATPMDINPTLTGMMKSNWRATAHGRDQLLAGNVPLRTATVGFDGKVFKDKLGDNSTFGLGGTIMTEQGLQGAVKSTYASLSSSYHIVVAEGDVSQQLGMGVGMTYGNRMIDYSKLQFQDQIDGGNSGVFLPSSETALSQMNGYLSANAGLTYSFTTEKTNIDLGLATYHINTPKRSYQNDESQYISRRYVAHANIESSLSDMVTFNGNAVYQNQYGTGYACIGGSFGILLDSDQKKETSFNIGSWYWTKYAIIPYVGFSYRSFQMGLSYDVAINKLAQNSLKARTFEVSITLRGLQNGGAIPAPWK